MRQRKTIVVFCSYSHKDEKFLKKMITHLSILKRQGVIKEWWDGEIGAGEEWQQEIDEHLEAADIILLLVSADFIASDFCWGKEMTRALDRHDAGAALVIPVVLRPVDWQGGAPFSRLQALPKDGKAITLWSNREIAWVEVAKGIRKKAEQLSRGASPVQRVIEKTKGFRFT